jgi:hypothetical protein
LPQGRDLELELRALDLLCIATRTLVEIKALLKEIRDRLAASESPARHAKPKRHRPPSDWWFDGWRCS